MKHFSFSDYTTTILEDSRVYANHAKKKTVDLEDIKLAITDQLSGSFAKPPPREVSLNKVACFSNKLGRK